MGMIDSIIAFVQSQWAMIAEAPVPFIAGWILFGGVAWAWARLQFSERLATAEDRLKLRDDQIKSYKDRLQGASPDEAREKMDALNGELRNLHAQLEALKSPPQRLVSPAAKDLLKEKLLDFSNWRISVFSFQDAECAHYATSIVDALLEAGLIASHGRFIVGPDPRNKDIDFQYYKDVDVKFALEFRSLIAEATGSPCSELRLETNAREAQTLGNLIVNRPSLPAHPS